MENTERFYAKDRATWRAWLEKHHDTEAAVWLVHDKGVHRQLTWREIVEEALCFGWIDGRANKVSDTQVMIYVSKRKPKSMWSKINKGYIDELIANGLMRPAGMAAIERGKLNGSWDVLNNSDNLIFPPELDEAFLKHPVALKNFEAFPPSSKRFTLQWIYDAKTDVTREKRIAQTIESAERNERIR